MSSSAHNVTYVTVVEDDDDDEWVTFGRWRPTRRRDDRVGLRGVGQRLAPLFRYPSRETSPNDSP